MNKMFLAEVNELEDSEFIILDTNLLIELYRISDLQVFTDFFSFIEDNNLTPIITETIHFEFIRSAHTKREKDARQEYLSNILEDDEPIPENQYIKEWSVKLGNIYANKNIEGSPNLADCFISANLVKYEDKVILGTCDLEDYPIQVFDRTGLGVIYTEEENKKIYDQISKIGFYKYSEDKLQNCLNDFSQTG